MRTSVKEMKINLDKIKIKKWMQCGCLNIIQLKCAIEALCVSAAVQPVYTRGQTRHKPITCEINVHLITINLNIIMQLQHHEINLQNYKIKLQYYKTKLKYYEIRLQNSKMKF